MSSGYSGNPLPKKLGLKDGQRAVFIGLPESLAWLADCVAFQECTANFSLPEELTGPVDVVHLFALAAADLDPALAFLRRRIAQDGMIWVSWPKKSAKVPTDLTEDVIRASALRNNLVDVKVCSVDEIWSGLKLVVPKALRTG